MVLVFILFFQEKAKVKEEIKQLKNLKKREIADKIEALKEVTGNPELGLSVNDLEGDFDPEAYDKMMKVCLTVLDLKFILLLKE